ncbi:exosome complex exonuclease Rrp41 [Candidatus Micrarchaeota archaeon]|nr:MAG: exosome complex exonuclease Rrp41 [Candidatus Micrarchaeota archaeon]
MVGGATTKELMVDGKRLDGRALDELRPVKITASVLNNADGSAYIEWGKNKVIAGVFGPRPCHPKRMMDPYRAIIKSRYRLAPFSTSDHGRAGPNRRSIELSKVIREAFESRVLLEQFPQTMIELTVEVLEADGGTRCASLVAASVALADAGIPMKDLVSAVAVGKINDQIALDLTGVEDNYGDSDIPFALAGRNKELMLFQMDGVLTKEQINQALDMGTKACEKVHQLQVEALKRVYESKKQEVEAKED